MIFWKIRKHFKKRCKLIAKLCIYTWIWWFWWSGTVSPSSGLQIAGLKFGKYSKNAETIIKMVKRRYQGPKILRKSTPESPKCLQKSTKVEPWDPQWVSKNHCFYKVFWLWCSKTVVFKRFFVWVAKGRPEGPKGVLGCLRLQNHWFYKVFWPRCSKTIVFIRFLVPQGIDRRKTSRPNMPKCVTVVGIKVAHGHQKKIDRAAGRVRREAVWPQASLPTPRARGIIRLLDRLVDRKGRDLARPGPEARRT